MIQWAEISSAEDKNRFEALGEVLTLFKVDHEGRHFTPERGAPYEEALREAKSWARTIHFRYPFVHVPVRSHLAHTNTVEWLEARDALVYERGSWWPRNNLYEALPKFFNLYQLPVDLHGSALILGAGGGGRTAAAAMIRMGFKKITIMDGDESRAEQAATSLKARFWGATLESQATSMLTHLPGVFSVVINAMSAPKEELLKSEISYFNFLSPRGVYADLKGFSDPGLMEEASRVGARLIYGAQITSLAEAHWLKSSFQLRATVKEIAQVLPQGLATPELPPKV